VLIGSRSLCSDLVTVFGKDEINRALVAIAYARLQHVNPTAASAEQS
jgi:hypothetical protein